jgi:cytochrome c biogenesis protein CcmG/thiol:disulfide interchange protein DsbE
VSTAPASLPAQKKDGVNKPMLVGGLLLTLFLVGVLGSGFGKDPHRLETDVLEGKQAPRYSLVALDGTQVNLGDYIGKQWVVLNFWSTWCGPCKIEHPHLVEAAELYPDVKWLGVIYQDEPDKAIRYLAQKGREKPGADTKIWNLPAHHALDASGAMSVDYGVTGVPETFFINPEGVVVKKYAEPIGARQIMAHLGPPRVAPK